MLKLIHGMDTMDIVATTDHTDTGDTMARGLLMLNQLRSQNLAQMLMPVLTHGMDTTAIIHMLIMVTTDHTDIGDTGERSKHKLTDNETIFLQKINFLGST